MSTMKRHLIALPVLVAVVLLTLSARSSVTPTNVANAAPSNAQRSIRVLLPAVSNVVPKPSPLAHLRRINVPYWLGSPNDNYSWSAILWFGQVNPLTSYADVRMNYNDQELFVSVNVIDRRLWYSTTMGSLTDWDSTSLYLNLGGNTGSVPTTSSFRLDGQLASNAQAVYQGNGSAWVASALTFTTSTQWRGSGPNDDVDDQGWRIDYDIPFASLGLSGPPANGTKWGLGMVLHNRDYLQFPPSPDETWPENLSANVPSTWGQLNFGSPAYTTPNATQVGAVTIRQGLNGAVVPDAAVGGTFSTTVNNLCGQSAGTWETWGNANFAGAERFNIQNQEDISDWMCYSKYYVTFPLSSLPLGKAIISSALTLYEFGNSGQIAPDVAYQSLIQVMTIDDDWNEATLTWNNAPLARENVSSAVVAPLSYVPACPGVPWTFDLSGAVREAYAAGKPLRIVLYEADRPQHSGKYFYSSDSTDCSGEGRPTLQVVWGNPQ